MREAVIVDTVRTPVGRGRATGALAGWHPVDLLAETLAALVDRTGIDTTSVDDVLVGCVSQIGEQSFNIARNATLAAGFPVSVPAATIDRQCGSSQQAVHTAAHAIVAGACDVVVAAGVESMSRVPLGASAADRDPFGQRLRARLADGLVPQGVAAELIAQRWGITREAADEYAARSHRRAVAAADDGRLAAELHGVVVDRGEGPTGQTLERDEGVRPGTSLQALADLAPAFLDAAAACGREDVTGIVTAGNASQISDGAAAALVVEREVAERLGLPCRARLRAFSVVGDDPTLMLTGIVPATREVLRRARLHINDIDVFEVNEAFAPVVLAWLAEFDVDPDRVNVRGGAIANGHPLGASGVKLLTSLVCELESSGGSIGLQVMCEGGGMANAMIVERAP